MSGASHLASTDAVRLLAFLPTRERALLDHLLACPACRQHVQEILAAAPGPPAPEPPLDPEYAEAVERVRAGIDEAAERLETERLHAEAAVAGLLATAPGKRRKRIRSEARLRTLPVAHLLIDRALAVASSNPAEAEHLALLGLFTLGRLDPDEAPGLAMAEVKVRGWAVVGRSCWQRGDWRAAREALECAEEVMVTEAYLSRRVGFRRSLAALRLVERRVEEAHALAGRAVDVLLAPLLGERGRLMAVTQLPTSRLTRRRPA